MKITELLEGRIPRKYWQPHSRSSTTEASNLPSAPSLNDEPQDELDGEEADDEEATVDGNAVGDFKQDAVSIGGGIQALSAWVYPEAWSGGGYSDILMHRITSLADELGVDLGDYSHLNDQDMADGRRLEIVFFNEQTDTLFRLSASGNDGRVEWSPGLSDLQADGSVTNAQMAALKRIEAAVGAWVAAVPEDWMDEPRDRRWEAAERKVVKLFSFQAPDVDGDDGDDPSESDPDHPNFWQGVDTRQDARAPDEAKKSMDDLIARAQARKAARLAQGK